jgi:hypothetical protein
MNARRQFPEVSISEISGFCPVQATGTIDGFPFYFRARGEHWSLAICHLPLTEPVWYHREPWGSEPFEAGYMTVDEATQMIQKGAALWASGAAGAT